MTKKKVYIITEGGGKSQQKKREREVKKIKRRCKERSIVLFSNTANIMNCLCVSVEEGMATYSSILTWRIPMDQGAWWATNHGVTESDMSN